MGQAVSKVVSEYVPVSITEAYNRFSIKRKRISSFEDDDETNLEESLHYPKKYAHIFYLNYILISTRPMFSPKLFH